MARLPQPGGDDGVWGQVLNDFLAQVHKTDGTLKDNIVTSASLAPDAVTTTSVVDDSVSEAKLDPAVRVKLNTVAGDPPVGGDVSGTVSNIQIDAGVIGTPEIADSSITSNKLTPGAVTSAAIASNTIDESKLNVSNAPSASNVLTWNGSALQWQAPSVVSTNLDDLADVSVAGATNGQVLSYQSGTSTWIAADVMSGAGVTDHGLLTGLADDDHPQYHNDTRGDVRYYTKSQMNTSLAGKIDTTARGAVNGVASLDGTGKVPSAQLPTAVNDPTMGGDLTGLASNAQLAAGVVGATELATNAVTTVKITDANVTLAKLAANSVNASKIVDGSVGTAELAADSVDASKILDGSVGTAELAASSVDASKLANNSVTTAKITDGNVTLAKLAVDSVDASKIVAGSVGNSELANDAVTETNIATPLSPTSNQVLSWNGTSLAWATPSSGFADPLTTKGDIIVRNASATTRLGVGTNGQVLTADSTAATGLRWVTGGSSGDVWTIVQRNTAGNYNASNNDWVIADTSSGAISVVLPLAASTLARVRVKRKGGSNGLQAITQGGELLDGVGSYNIAGGGQSQDFQSDGTEWYSV